jgi:hypothetical protein
MRFALALWIAVALLNYGMAVGSAAGRARAAQPVVLSVTAAPAQEHVCRAPSAGGRYLCPSFGEPIVMTARVRDADTCTFLGQRIPFSSLYPVRTVNCSSGSATVTVPAVGNPYTRLVHLTYAVFAQRAGRRTYQHRVTVDEAAAATQAVPPRPAVTTTTTTTINPTPAPAQLPPPVAGLSECTAGPHCFYGPIYATYNNYGNIAPANLGDCSFAAAADWEQIVLHRTPDPSVIGYEFAQAGGSAADGLTLTAFFNYWQQQGIAGVVATGLHSYFTDQTDVENGVRNYGALIAVFQLVAGDGFAQYTVGAGNHVAVVDGFTPEGPLVVSWGQTLQMTWAQWNGEVSTMWGVATG